MRNVLGKFSLFLLGLLVMSMSYSQQVVVKGGFVEDSLKIGQDIHFWLSAHYPEKIDLILPDTTFNFQPFEFSGKTYFPGKISDSVVIDSAVYTLQSFEIDAIQLLSLPVFVLNTAGDTLRIASNTDSIIFTTLVPVVTDSTRLKTNLAYQDVSRQFNFPLLWIILGVLAVIAIAVLLIFGKKIRKRWFLRKLGKRYATFSAQLSAAIDQLKKAPEQQLAEHTLSLWKNFMETLENKPFSRYTTKEIMALDYTDELNATLKNIDRCVYGGKLDPALFKDFQVVEDFTQYRYNVVVDQVKSDERSLKAESSKKEKEFSHPLPAPEIQSTQLPKRLNNLDYQEELLKGGKFVIYYFTISIIVMTFRRTSKIYFVKHNENSVMKGLPYTLITFIFGWWGIPWGIVYTPQSLYVNLRGGKDITNEVVHLLRKR